MAVSGTRVSVGTTATLLSDASGSGAGGAYSDGISVLVRNADASAAVDLGGSGVTSGAGFSLPAGASVSLDLDPAEKLYAIAASGTVSVHVLGNRA